MKTVTIEFEIPDEANWIAMDEDGCWCWHTDRPAPKTLGNWEYGGYWDSGAEEVNMVVGCDKSRIDWKSTLREIK